MRANEQRIKCQVTIKTKDGEQTYEGLFPSTCDAAIDAQKRIGLQSCKVVVRAIP